MEDAFEAPAAPVCNMTDAEQPPPPPPPPPDNYGELDGGGGGDDVHELYFVDIFFSVAGAPVANSDQIFMGGASSLACQYQFCIGKEHVSAVRAANFSAAASFECEGRTATARKNSVPFDGTVTLLLQRGEESNVFFMGAHDYTMGRYFKDAAEARASRRRYKGSALGKRDKNIDDTLRQTVSIRFGAEECVVCTLDVSLPEDEYERLDVDRVTLTLLPSFWKVYGLRGRRKLPETPSFAGGAAAAAPDTQAVYFPPPDGADEALLDEICAYAFSV